MVEKRLVISDLLGIVSTTYKVKSVMSELVLSIRSDKDKTKTSFD